MAYRVIFGDAYAYTSMPQIPSGLIWPQNWPTLLIGHPQDILFLAWEQKRSHGIHVNAVRMYLGAIMTMAGVFRTDRGCMVWLDTLYCTVHGSAGVLDRAKEGRWGRVHWLMDVSIWAIGRRDSADTVPSCFFVSAMCFLRHQSFVIGDKTVFRGRYTLFEMI